MADYNFVIHCEVKIENQIVPVVNEYFDDEIDQIALTKIFQAKGINDFSIQTINKHEAFGYIAFNKNVNDWTDCESLYQNPKCVQIRERHKFTAKFSFIPVTILKTVGLK